MIAFLWAQANNGVIGKAGRLPWHLPDDLAYFKQQTLGTLTVMGRKTYLGLPKRPLPRRTNVVLTHDEAFTAEPGVVVVHSQAQLCELAAAHPDQDVLITGGAGVFASLRDLPDTLLVTRLAGDFAGDVKMIDLPWQDYTLVASRTVTNSDPALTHTFETWRKI
ncbi:dihydrofolate reductase [Lacticaseibacillus jixiensis]|uniref:dihydrofolate reductase n=1 Tax=Lacticaseibacillus jixiensis TaxID=3231926 RepID=UPI0036F311A0